MTSHQEIEGQKLDGPPLIRIGQSFVPFRGTELKSLDLRERTAAYNSPVPSSVAYSEFLLGSEATEDLERGVKPVGIACDLLVINKRILDEAMRMARHTMLYEEIIFEDDTLKSLIANNTAIETPLRRKSQTSFVSVSEKGGAEIVTDVPLILRLRTIQPNPDQRDFLKGVDLQVQIGPESYLKRLFDQAERDTYTSDYLLRRRDVSDMKVVLLPYGDVTPASISVTPQLR